MVIHFDLQVSYLLIKLIALRTLRTLRTLRITFFFPIIKFLVRVLELEEKKNHYLGKNLFVIYDE